jgi:hypothetical protein
MKLQKDPPTTPNLVKHTRRLRVCYRNLQQSISMPNQVAKLQALTRHIEINSKPQCYNQISPKEKGIL